MDDRWTSIQFKIGTSVVHIVFFCFQIPLIIGLQIRFCNGFGVSKLSFEFQKTEFQNSTDDRAAYPVCLNKPLLQN